MNESPVKIRDLIKFSFLSLIIILFVFLSYYFDIRTKIVFCDVGQGDAAYIRIKNKVDILVDAGPDRKVLNCLGKYMPFWDRKIELIFVSHNQTDHFGGLDYILDHYQVGSIYLVNDISRGSIYNALKKKIVDKKIRIETELAGKTINVLNDKISILWPTEGLKSNDDNDFSSVLLFECRGGSRPALPFRLLFTGDASPYTLSRLSHGYIEKVDILKIPHHGSKNGLTKNFLDLADPVSAVISVGKNNTYGHPSKEVLDMLKAKNIKIKRTDEDGSILFNLPN